MQFANMNQPLAIVGMGCRFPGGLNDLDSFWTGLINKVNTIGPVPADRWNTERFFAEDDQASGKMYVRRGGFVTQNFREFDAEFFGISPREASFMDPQQRFLLEVTWEAFENAGIDPSRYDGRDVGVYVGGFTLDHLLNQLGSASREHIGPHSAVGSTMTILAARISHVFNFRGPAMSLDTACSSSLVAFHYGCQDVWAHRCDMAVVGGVNVMFRPEYLIAMCKGKFLARDGHCKSFDARGDGYARGEGCGIVLVKRLADAQADGDPIWALVEATGVNQDGRTNGITVPCGQAQQALMKRVLEEAGIPSRAVQFVEAHGTGTAVGDPIEATAIGSVYGAGRDDRGCIIGSVKSNIGHLEAGAGVAGLIKLVLSLRHGMVPALATLVEPHPDIPFDRLGIRLADGNLPIASEGTSGIYAAINSFGYGGTNAHAILSQLASEEAVPSSTAVEPRRTLPHVLPVSARSPQALSELAGRYRDHLVSFDGALNDFVYSAARHRAHLTHRASVIGESREDLLRGLTALASGTDNPSVRTGTQSYSGARRPVFVYTGMGPQWWGMGQQLWREDPVFRATVAEADRVFEHISGFSILTEMLKDEANSRITETQFAQPANFMVQIGISAILRAAGVIPGAIVGHSVGEVSSSYIAGALSLEDALTVSFHRSRVQKKAANTGSMLAASLTQSEAEEMLLGGGGGVSIGAINGPKTITFSGNTEELKEIAAALDARGIFNRVLRVEVPYHSPMMEPLKQELAECLAHIVPRIPAVPLYSTVTGDRIDVIAYDAEYWTHNIRQPVYFADAIRNILADDFTSFVEVGPHPVLSAALKECFAAARIDAVSIETLRRMEAERPRIVQAVAQVYTSGCDLDWSCQYPSGRFVRLPHYPWQRELLWNEGEGCSEDRTAASRAPLLGANRAGAIRAWEKDLATESLRYLTDHVVDGLPILPAAAFIEAILELAHAEAGEGESGAIIRNLKLRKALPLDRSLHQRLTTEFVPDTRRVAVLSFGSNVAAGAAIHATGEICPLIACQRDRVDLEALAARMIAADGPDALYARFEQRGLAYGPFFRTIRKLRLTSDAREMLVQLALAPGFDFSEGTYLSNPTLLDGCFQALIALLSDEGSSTPFLPTSIREFRLHRAFPDTLVCHGILTERTHREIACDLRIYDEDGALVAEVNDARFTALGVADTEAAVPAGAYQYTWTLSEEGAPAVRLGRWVAIGAPGQYTLSACAAALRNEGVSAVTIVGIDTPGEDGWCLRPGDIDAAAGMLSSIGEVDGVVFVADPGGNRQGSDPTGERNVAALMTLIQALVQHKDAARPRVYVLTQGAFKVNDGDTTVLPAQGALVGFTRVAFNELESLRCTTIDLPALVDQAIVQAAARELVIDSPVDEVAFRREGRLVSELLNSEVLRHEQIVSLELAQQPTFVLRLDPVTGTAIARELRPEPLETAQVRLVLDSAVLPGAAFGLPHADDDARPQWMEADGIVAEVGAGVSNLAPGTRVCGYVPLGFSAHVVADRADLHLCPVPEGGSNHLSVSAAMLLATAELLASSADISARDRILVWGNATGLALAHVAISRGAAVAMLLPAGVEETDLGALASVPAYAPTVTGIDLAIAEQTGGRGFSVFCIPLDRWSRAFDFHALTRGGRVIDLDEVARPFVMDRRIGLLVRRDVSVLLHQRSEPLLLRAADILSRAERVDIPGLEAPYLHVADLLEVDPSTMAAQERVALHYLDDGRPLRATSAEKPTIRSDGTYLITGGLGGLGQEVALWLVDRGARHLALLSRSGANSEDKQAFVAELEARGVSVLAPRCDTGNPGELAALFTELERQMPPVRGVFHSAAVVDDAPIPEMNVDRLYRVMAPKAGGAWSLHTLTEAMELDYFVLFSSISPLVGNSRQSNYAAANAFLDALAWHRTLRGLPATSLNWGAISDAGMVSKDERVEMHLRSIGLTPIPVRRAFAGMERALARGVVQVCISETADWSQWAVYETLGGESPRFATLVSEARGQKDQSALGRLQARLRDVEPEGREEALALLLASIYATELRLSEDTLDIDRPVASFGVDSLLGLNIQMGIEVYLGLKISTLELIGNNTLRNLAGKCLRDLGLDQSRALVAAE